MHLLGMLTELCSLLGDASALLYKWPGDVLTRTVGHSKMYRP